MPRRLNSKPRILLGDVCRALQTMAPLDLAQDWDNVGLLAGNREDAADRALLCIDLTPAVLDEAARKGVNLIVAYHPPIFRPLNRLVAPGNDMAATVFRCIRAGIAIYSTHTALDAADGGTNDHIASLCGIGRTEPIEFAGGTDGESCKVVVFVPAQDADAVADAMFAAGAGWIGDYDKCSFRIPGTGTFRGGESTNPVIGQAGRYETVDEIRIESITPKAAMPAVVDAIRRAHPYEEPAFDIYPLRSAPRRGIGRIGELPDPITLAALAKRLKKATGAGCVQLVGPADRGVSRVIIVVGAAGSLPFRVGLTARDVIVTGEIRHHDALSILRSGAAAIVLGHWSSERPILQPFSKTLSERVPGLDVIVSESDANPFHCPRL